MSKKRILWLFNHTSLRKVQVPLLIELGYEVYCPKIYSFEFGDYSASISYEYDASLTLSDEVLETLNHIDFYQAISPENMDLVNRYFDMVICMAIPNIVEEFLRSFQGIVLLQGFGLSSNGSYTDILTEAYISKTKYGTLSKLRAREDSFWLLLTYDNISAIEAPILKNRSLYMPIGMKDAFPLRRWQGGDKRILFIAPKIKTNSYYRQVYENFKKDFADFPCVIGGAQVQDVPEDVNVVGFLPENEYVYNMTKLAAMFYHSQEPRHLHYHPLEAIKWGMPLIFMAGGVLDDLGGKNLPGRAKTIPEARKKLKRLVNGDKAFIKAVTKSQTILLKPFTREYIRPYWVNGMKRIEESVQKPLPRKKKIAVILPAAYLGGVADYAHRFATILQEENRKHGENWEIVFAYPNEKIYEEEEYFNDLRSTGIKLRPFEVEERNGAWVENALTLAGFKSSFYKPAANKICVMRDGASDFQDIDYAVFMSDMVGSKPLFFLKPYAMVVHDYIQRYVPEAVSPSIDNIKLQNQCNADFVVVTSEPTKEDALRHGKITEDRVILAPPLLDLVPQKYISDAPKGDYFIWSTNATSHKNHLVALRALEKYYSEGGTLVCIVTGVGTTLLSPNTELPKKQTSKFSLKKILGLKDDRKNHIKYLQAVQSYVEGSDSLKKHLKFKGNMPKERYYQILAKAKFVFHPGYGDNGNFTVTEAASMGVPSLCSDYPAMRYLADFTGIPVRYMDPFSARAMTEALLDMENSVAVYAKEVPEREEMEKKSYKYQSEAIYNMVKRMVGV